MVAWAQISVAPNEGSPGNLGEDLFHASSAATGAKLCDRRQAARYMLQFTGRYGERVQALARYHEARFGKDPDFLFTSDCHRLPGARRQQDREHARAMNRFDRALRDLEHRYGPPAKGG
jgi:hypothetical protein